MTDAPKVTPADAAEARRVEALRRYDVLDTPPEESIDRITRLARATLDAPAAFISLIDGKRQWMKSRLGDIPPETRREASLCNLTIQQPGPLLINDVSTDPRFGDSPLAMDGVRFYLGVPLRTPDGYNIGALCVVDYVPRTVTPEQIYLMEDLARLVIDQFELLRLARHDTLTGALTRRAFQPEAAREYERSRRHNLPLSMILCDIDYFKSINDAFGHPMGDRALIAVADIIRASMRVNDLFTRLGGEEFSLLLPDTSIEGATDLADRLRRRIAALTIEHGDRNVRVSASFGVTSLYWNDQSIAHMTRRADVALYEAKAGGRNRVVVAGGSPDGLSLAG